jgi:hypothetical protein
MADRYVQVNLEKLEAMRRDWQAVVNDRGPAMAKLNEQLKQSPTVAMARVAEYYNGVLELGRAGGRVELLDEMIASLTSHQTPYTPQPASDEDPNPEGDFRVG